MNASSPSTMGVFIPEEGPSLGDLQRIEDHEPAPLPGQSTAGEAAGRDMPGPEPGACPNEAEDDPHRLARAYLESRRHEDGHSSIRQWIGEWHFWDGSAYSVISEKEQRADVGEFIKAEFDRLNLAAIREWEKGSKVTEQDKPIPKPMARKVTEPLKTNVLGCLSGLALVPIRAVPQMPAWLDGDGCWPADEVLPARNGLVHLPSVVENRQHLIAPTPRYFSTFALDYGFHIHAPPPLNFLTFLGAMPLGDQSRIKLQLWPSDPRCVENKGCVPDCIYSAEGTCIENHQCIGTLQEWMGLQLVPDTRYQKIAVLIGPKRSGKGTIARVIRAVVGPSNVAGPTLSGLRPTLASSLSSASNRPSSATLACQAGVMRRSSSNGS